MPVLGQHNRRCQDRPSEHVASGYACDKVLIYCGTAEQHMLPVLVLMACVCMAPMYCSSHDGH